MISGIGLCPSLASHHNPAIGLGLVGFVQANVKV